MYDEYLCVAAMMMVDVRNRARSTTNDQHDTATTMLTTANDDDTPR